MSLALPQNSADRAHLAAALRYRWSLHARPEQLPPAGDEWRTWFYMAGRGAGKTRSGAEAVRAWAESRTYRIIHLIAPTASDLRDTMVEGPAGILAVSPPWFRPRYEPSKRRLTWPNGVRALLFSADEPERLRGPQCEALWADEVASWRRPEAWDMAMFGLRLGSNPRAIVTSTPKPTRLIKGILKDPAAAVTLGTTYDNRANLAAAFFEQIIRKYEGTRLGRQELLAQMLDDNPRALWRRDNIEADRLLRVPEGVNLVRVVVAVDPSANEGPDETGEKTGDDAGIITPAQGSDGHYYVLADNTMAGSPLAWARAAVTAYHDRKADRVIAEANNGGAMVSALLKTVDSKVPVRLVRATRGKVIRAEPISALYEQHLVHHVGCFPELEDELCQWEPGEESPNRLDALVWGLTELTVRKLQAVTTH